ncbi:unnamed protein product [Rotaria sp. Silwood2]|nr:unnamed protein product [Rotaria sp. Silwood2]CAF4393142.1 unnamed protein product [Rotaria sp. Silwood2]
MTIILLQLFKHKTSLEYEFLNDAAQHFQSHSTALGGIKCEGDPAMQLLNYSRDLFRQIEQNFYKSQQSLSDSDQEMCKCLHGDESKIDGVDMDNQDSNDIDDFME